MPRWFPKSTPAQPAGPDREPQAFEVACECGRSVAGVRRRRHQTIECDACGADVFVLPADVYPPLKPPKKRRSKNERRRQAPVAAARPEPVVRPGEEAAEPIFDSDDEVPAVETKAAPAGCPLGPAAAVLAVPQQRTSRVTPFRAVMLAMAVIVSLTVWWGLRSHWRDQAAGMAKAGREQGDAALADGDLAAAAGNYRQAREAVEYLGRQDDWARHTVQLAKETGAAANLAAQPLLPIVEEAHRTLSAAGSEEERLRAEAQALGLHAGQWIVIETTLIAVSGGGSSTRWIVDYPLTVGTSVVEIDAGLPIFETLGTGGTSQRVLFAAQLARCRMIQDPRPTLIVEFDPRTAFLWTNAETLKHVGLAGDEQAAEATLSLLDRQARIAGGSR